MRILLVPLHTQIPMRMLELNSSGINLNFWRYLRHRP